MSFVVAIPSSNRQHSIRLHTLRLLYDAGIPAYRIYIFVPPEQVDAYVGALGLAKVPHVIAAPPRIANTHNFIHNFFGEGTPILGMDDDIREVYIATGPNSKHVLKQDFEQVVSYCFSETKRRGFNLWGVYHYENTYWMKNRVTTDLKLICGAFFGMFNTHDPTVYVKTDHGDDVERSILFYRRDGGVVRFQKIGYTQNYAKEEGGMQDYRDKQNADAGINYILNTYPEFTETHPETCTLSGFKRLKLKDKRPKK